MSEARENRESVRGKAPPGVPEDVPWSPLAGLGLVALLILLQAGLGFLAPGVGGLAATIVVYLCSVVGVLAAMAVGLGMRTRGDQSLPRLLGLVNPGARGLLAAWKPLLAGGAVYLSVVLSYYAVLNAAGVAPDEIPHQPLVDVMLKEQSTATLLLAGFAAVVAAPLVEELLFRSVLYLPLRRRWGPVWAALAVSLLFAFAHQWVWGVPQLVVLSLVFVALFEHTGTLLAPVVAHACYNGVEIVLLLALRSADFPVVQAG